MTFDVTLTDPKPPSLDLDKNRRGEIAYSVKNTKKVEVKAAAHIQPIGATPREWLSLSLEANQWTVKADAQTQVKIIVNVPVGQKSTTQYSCQLVVVNDASPQTDFTVGEAVSFTVIGIPDPTPSWWQMNKWWIIPASVLGPLVAIAIILWVKTNERHIKIKPIIDPMVSVPLLKGHTLAEARRNLTDVGLKESDDINVGTIPDSVKLKVWDQDQPEGKKVSPGATVILSLLRHLSLPTDGIIDFEKLAGADSPAVFNDIQLERPVANAPCALNVSGSAKIAAIPIAGTDGGGVACVCPPFGAATSPATSLIQLTANGIVIAGSNGRGTPPFFVRVNQDGRMDPSFNSTGWMVAPNLAGSPTVKLNYQLMAISDQEGSPEIYMRQSRNNFFDSAVSQLIVWSARQSPVGAWTYAPPGLLWQFGLVEASVVSRDGQLIVAGRKTKMFLARVTTAGLLDTGFNNGTVAGSPDGSHILALATAVDGKILVASNVISNPPVEDGSFSLTRFGSDGTPDAGFGVVPVVQSGNKSVGGIKISFLSDDGFLVGGTVLDQNSKHQGFLIHFTADGKQAEKWVLPNSFSTVEAPNSPNPYGLSALASLPYGRAIFLGQRQAEAAKSISSQFEQARLFRYESVAGVFRADGALDSSFGSEGITPLPKKAGAVSAVTIGTDGKIVFRGDFGVRMHHHSP